MSTANATISDESPGIRKIRAPQIPILFIHMTVPSEKTEEVVLDVEAEYARMKTRMWSITAWIGFPFVVKKKIREIKGPPGWKKRLCWWAVITSSVGVTWASLAPAYLQPIGKVIQLFFRLRGWISPSSNG